MSKKSNTWLFILGATVFNILTTLIFFVVMLVIYMRFILPGLGLPEDSLQIALPVVFIGAIAVSFVTYRLILKQVMKRVNMEEHFDPLFGPRRRR